MRLSDYHFEKKYDYSTLLLQTFRATRPSGCGIVQIVNKRESGFLMSFNLKSDAGRQQASFLQLYHSRPGTIADHVNSILTLFARRDRSNGEQGKLFPKTAKLESKTRILPNEPRSVTGRKGLPACGKIVRPGLQAGQVHMRLGLGAPHRRPPVREGQSRPALLRVPLLPVKENSNLAIQTLRQTRAPMVLGGGDGGGVCW